MKTDSIYSTNIKLEAKDFWGDKYIILDLEGNLIDVVDEKQFEKQYAVLKSEDEK